MAILAPSRAKACAIALPMPLAAPVTTATLSVRRMASLLREGGGKTGDGASTGRTRRRGRLINGGARIAFWSAFDRRLPGHSTRAVCLVEPLAEDLAHIVEQGRILPVGDRIQKVDSNGAQPVVRDTSVIQEFRPTI
jgi:hypothetical protein